MRLVLVCVLPNGRKLHYNYKVDIIIHVTTPKHTKFQKLKLLETHRHFIIRDIRNFVEKKCYKGARPTECDYCWNVEDNSDRFSDRIFKSGESWSYPFINDIIQSDWRDDFNPKYVEVAFSNACNFKCSYCGPAYSSKWMEEIQEFGAYPTLDNFNSVDWMKNEDKCQFQKEHNPYVEAFWKWWPDLYRDLHTFRITGGEPLM
jgi:hypothetical protein